MGITAVYDIIIVGAGPGGIAAAVKAKEAGLNYLIVEKGEDIFSGIISSYPTGKEVYPTIPKGASEGYLMSLLKPPEKKVTIEEFYIGVKEALKNLGGLNIKTVEEFKSFHKEGEILVVQTNKADYQCRNLILAIGSNIPRKLKIYGDARPIARTLHDPNKYLNQNVLVIGGGNTGADVVITLSKLKREKGDQTKVYWANRGEKFEVVREVARDLGEEILLGGDIEILEDAKPVIGEVDESGIRRLTIRIEEYSLDDEIKIYRSMSFPMKNVIACIGFMGPAQIFEQLGMELMTHETGRKLELVILDENMQTSIKTVYAIGGAISPSYIKRSKDGKSDEVKHLNLIYTAVNDGAHVVEHIASKLKGSITPS